MKRSVYGVCALALALFVSCTGRPIGQPDPYENDDGPIAEGISAKLGEPIPTATAEQLSTFERGKDVMQQRFDLADGLGPAFNVTFCGACHEKPTSGGSAGLYRSFLLAGTQTEDGAFVAGSFGGVIRMYNYDLSADYARPTVSDTLNRFGQRNPIPFFGAGLIAQIPDDVILANADPEDEDGDGISGKPNYDRGFVGRFGRKSQTVSIEGFIRGPLFNHLGVTTDPLTDEQRAELPVDSSTQAATDTARAVHGSGPGGDKIDPHMQAAAPDGPTTDDDGAGDPEMSSDELFDLVSFSMLLAAPQFEDLSDDAEHGRQLFHQAGCSDCHIPRLDSPRGPIPVYSDLLLHDMGADLADGIVMRDAGASEFRTQPLWGIAAVGPYLHDGRAGTIEEAILWHGGEADDAREAYEAYSDDDRADVVEFLLSLGGRDQMSRGLLPTDAPVPDAGEYGGPFRELDEDETDLFIRGRELFDAEFTHTMGVGQPRFNGDSCRACHFDPVIGGAGPRGVNVMRHGILNENGEFTPPMVGTILHKQSTVLDAPILPQDECNIFEQRQTPHTFGLGLIEAIPSDVILANADPDDAVTPDGITGRVSMTDDGRVGRFGWKAQVPSVAEFVRDAMAAELGMTVAAQEGLTFGQINDNDEVTDPELSVDEAEELAFFIAMLAPPPRDLSGDAEAITAGEAVFAAVGCTKCHIPTLTGDLGDVPLYSDLLLHEILPEGAAGIEDTSANMREFRTAPLWGLGRTAPYFHTGEADTIDEAIRLHEGEAAAIRDAYAALPDADRAALLAFLESL